MQQPEACHAIAELLRPLDLLCTTSEHVQKAAVGSFQCDDGALIMQRFTFSGPAGGGDSIRLGLFATIHGDEPEGALAIIEWLQQLTRHPEKAKGYIIDCYPCCNPSGYLRKHRFSASGKDLNREFWKDSTEPEICLLERELESKHFDGIVALHSDDTSDGLYGFVSGHVLSQDLLEPMLQAAGTVLPRNTNLIIDSFPASHGIIVQGYNGVLTAPPSRKERPFELVFETPQKSPIDRQVHAMVLALETLLNEYRSIKSIAMNI